MMDKGHEEQEEVIHYVKEFPMRIGEIKTAAEQWFVDVYLRGCDPNQLVLL